MKFWANTVQNSSKKDKAFWKIVGHCVEAKIKEWIDLDIRK